MKKADKVLKKGMFLRTGLIGNKSCFDFYADKLLVFFQKKYIIE